MSTGDTGPQGKSLGAEANALQLNSLDVVILNTCFWPCRLLGGEPAFCSLCRVLPGVGREKWELTVTFGDWEVGKASLSIEMGLTFLLGEETVS